MQFIEKNAFNVRSAIYRLKKGGNEPEFILFPMIHIGEKEYYREVRHLLLECDLIFAEGVMSKKTALLTRAYRAVAKKKGLGLVTQRDLKLSDFRERVVNVDMNAGEFDEGWSNIPPGTRFLIFLAMPFYAIYLYLFGTRNLIAEGLAVEDLPSREEVLQQEANWENIERLILNQRDQKLTNYLERFRARSGEEKMVIAIVYGAMHMRAVSEFLLHKLGYRIDSARWITVFNL